METTDAPAIDSHEGERAEEGLVAIERSLELIIDTMPALVWSARPDGNADFFNRHYLDFIGFSSDQARIGSGWTAAVHPEDLIELGRDMGGDHGFRRAGRGRSAYCVATTGTIGGSCSGRVR